MDHTARNRPTNRKPKATVPPRGPTPPTSVSSPTSSATKRTRPAPTSELSILA